MSSKTSKSRYLYLREVADILKLEHEDQKTRVEHVRKLFLRLEKRDGVKYLHKFGTRNSPYKVCADDLCQLDPWNPMTLQELRAKIKEIESDNQELRARVARLERFAEGTQNYLKSKSA